jgi:predicted Fe-Mo cluster-binding NifX family protein
MNVKNRVAGILILINQKKDNQMKIAVITDDGNTISQHFGRAPYYMVFTIEEGKITNREMRNKMGHNQFAGEPHEEHHGASHGQDPASHDKHVQMANSIADCQVLLCGGMGMGAYVSMQQLNIKPIVTDFQEIDAAVQAYIDGKIEDHTEMLH